MTVAAQHTPDARPPLDARATRAQLAPTQLEQDINHNHNHKRCFVAKTSDLSREHFVLRLEQQQQQQQQQALRATSVSPMSASQMSVSPSASSGATPSSAASSPVSMSMATIDEAEQSAVSDVDNICRVAAAHIQHDDDDDDEAPSDEDDRYDDGDDGPRVAAAGVARGLREMGARRVGVPATAATTSEPTASVRRSATFASQRNSAAAIDPTRRFDAELERRARVLAIAQLANSRRRNNAVASNELPPLATLPATTTANASSPASMTTAPTSKCLTSEEGVPDARAPRLDTVMAALPPPPPPPQVPPTRQQLAQRAMLSQRPVSFCGDELLLRTPIVDAAKQLQASDEQLNVRSRDDQTNLRYPQQQPLQQPLQQQPQQQQQQQQPPVQRRRKCSRSEHRRSLAEIGYGKSESYVRLQRLGKGTYATVFMGRSRLSNELIALKEIDKQHDEGAPCTAIREVSLLRFLRHNNIITLHDICHTATKLTLVFEYVGPDLYTYIRQNNYLLAMQNVRHLLFQLLRGLAYCHARQVLHRDLKPQNLLVNRRGELKICDFGLARAKSIPTKSYSNEVVTLWYRPPDVLLGSTNYDAAIDMWGVGCVFFELVSGRTLFPGSSVQQQLYLIFSLLGSPNRVNWPEALSMAEYRAFKFPPFRPEPLSYRAPRLESDGLRLMHAFLRYKPSERWSAERAMCDPFFARHMPPQVYSLNDRESIFDVPGVEQAQNPGQKINKL